MDTLPLPPRPDLEQYRKRAKALVAAANTGDPDAVKQWADDWLRTLTKLLGVEITPFIQHSFDRAVEEVQKEVAARVTRAKNEGAIFALADAQHLIARAHSYDSWADFTREIEGLRSDSGKSDFERAADAVVVGDMARLNELLEKNPDLIREHSTRKHHATLLHYVAANGVEDFRQKTPPNAVAIAQRLIDAGAEVDALADTYGGDTYQTTMNLLVSSTHPAEAGLQSKLVDVLLDHGAAIDGLAKDSSPILTALAFGYREAADTLARRGAAINHVVVAAAIGRLDLVHEWVVDAHTLARAHGPYVGPYWVHIPDDAKGQIEMALVWACKFGRAEVAKFLLDRGVDVASKDNDDMTALHWASARGLLDIMEILLSARAPLEVRNTWGGTVVDSTTWFAVNFPLPDVDYPRVIERLLEAGADPREVHPPSTGISAIDGILEKYRASGRN
jgi:ankyrin repeat protein